MAFLRSFVPVSAFVLAMSATAIVCAQSQRRQNPVFAPIERDPALPDVLLIGDSISIGYTLPLREILAGEANVHRIPVNGGPTTRGLEQLKDWLGETDWDVIHFNWGLHDLKYIDEDSQLADPETGHQQVPADEYETNLLALVEQLKQTGAELIWCSTTPVPEGAAGRVPGGEAPYNEIAARVMEQQDVRTNDLCGFAQTRLKEIQRPANVHFTPEGSQVLAEEVARNIRDTLAGLPSVSIQVPALRFTDPMRSITMRTQEHEPTIWNPGSCNSASSTLHGRSPVATRPGGSPKPKNWASTRLTSSPIRWTSTSVSGS